MSSAPPPADMNRSAVMPLSLVATGARAEDALDIHSDEGGVARAEQHESTELIEVTLKKGTNQGLGLTLDTMPGETGAVLVFGFYRDDAGGMCCAEESGAIQLHDEIVAVDGDQVAGESLSQITRRLGGKADLTMTLKRRLRGAGSAAVSASAESSAGLAAGVAAAGPEGADVNDEATVRGGKLQAICGCGMAPREACCCARCYNCCWAVPNKCCTYGCYNCCANDCSIKGPSPPFFGVMGSAAQVIEIRLTAHSPRPQKTDFVHRIEYATSGEAAPENVATSFLAKDVGAHFKKGDCVTRARLEGKAWAHVGSYADFVFILNGGPCKKGTSDVHGAELVAGTVGVLRGYVGSGLSGDQYRDPQKGSEFM